MKRLGILTIFTFLLTALYSAQKPNVIVVLMDDVGVGDVSSYRRLHSENIILETPNIDALVNNGMMFTQAHAPAALCAPSRYAIMTGNSCYRSYAPWGVWGSYQPSPITDKDLTLGRLMKKAGYKTAFFGKWHLGGDYKRKSNPSEIYRGPRHLPQTDIDVTHIEVGPNEKGFDYSLTFPAGIQAEPYVVYEDNQWLKCDKHSEIVFIDQERMNSKHVKLDKAPGLGDSHWDPHHMGPLLVNKATDYIDTNANTETPFFMYYCSQAVHKPHTPCDSLDGIAIKGSTPSHHMDMIKEMDVQMGMLIKTLKKNDIYDNTIFIFTSDNGGLGITETLESGHQPSSIYRGHKNLMYEGGHRVPFIVQYPGVVKKGTVNQDPILGLDIMATLAAITNTEIPKGTAQDSYNLLPLLKQKRKAESHDFLMVQSGTPKQVIIIKDGIKLIIQVDKKDRTDATRTPIALFDLNVNPSENEEDNLINNPAYKETIEHLFTLHNTTRDSKIITGSSK